MFFLALATCEIALKGKPQDFTGDKSTIGSGDGLVPSGNKPLPDPILTHINVAIWHHQATMG